MFLDSKEVFVIAEAGVNHNGNLNEAIKLIDIAVDAKANAVKFQTFKAEEITTIYNHNVDYMKDNTQLSNFDLLKKLSLEYEDFRKLKNYSEKKGIIFMSTPDGENSLDFLCDNLKVSLVKIGSTEVTNLEYLSKISKKNLPCVLSTGLSNINEVKRAYQELKKFNDKEICVLHCTSEYPAPDDEINLNAMLTIKKELGCSVGFSDHSIGNEASIIAVGLGAVIIEKHFTSDKNLEGPDHKASLNGIELKNFIKSIRRSEKMLGNGEKLPTKSELKNLNGIRRGVVASMNCPKGLIIKKEHLDYKRPFLGINPEDSKKLIGKKLNTSLKKDQPILWEYIN